MKVDWKKRYDDLKREHNAKMKQLAEEFGPLQFVAYDISQMDFGCAKTRCEIHLPKIAQILGREYFDYFKEAAR